MKRKILYFLVALLFINGAVWTSPVLSEHRQTQDEFLKVSFLDVSQGDAIYIEAPNGNNMLVDGGPEDLVLSPLQEVLQRKKEISILVVTNPDADHISGFRSVIPLYKIGTVFEPGTSNTTETYKDLEALITEYKIPKLIAEKGTKIILDKEKGVYFEVLFPDRDVSGWERNDGSIVGRLVYGETSIMLMGDATTTTENAIMLTTEKERIKSDILKIGHHGSRTSSSLSWLMAVSPRFAIISSGENNRYGHPHEEVTNRLRELAIPFFNTKDEGTITYISDGKNFTKK